MISFFFLEFFYGRAMAIYFVTIKMVRKDLNCFFFCQSAALRQFFPPSGLLPQHLEETCQWPLPKDVPNLRALLRFLGISHCHLGPYSTVWLTARCWVEVLKNWDRKILSLENTWKWGIPEIYGKNWVFCHKTVLFPFAYLIFRLFFVVCRQREQQKPSLLGLWGRLFFLIGIPIHQGILNEPGGITRLHSWLSSLDGCCQLRRLMIHDCEDQKKPWVEQKESWRFF